MNFSHLDVLEIVPEVVPLNTTLWNSKHTLEQLKIIETGSPYVYSGQYQHDPSPAGGGMFKDKYWKYYELLPNDLDLLGIYGDTAQKTAEIHDYSVFQFWGRSRSGGIYLIDQIRDKWESPQLESNLVEFWEKHKPTIYKPRGAQFVKVEDKSSGSSLIQSIKQNYNIPIEGIQRNKDKVLRSMGVVNYFAQGYINIPKYADWLHDYKEEFRKFTPLMTHKHDDQIDPTVDAVEDMLIFKTMLYNHDNVGMHR